MTSTNEPPQPIHQTAGECIQVLLGSSGSQYLIVEENCIDKHQNVVSNLIPLDLAKHTNNEQGRRLCRIAMSQTGEWFVCSVKSDGTDAVVVFGGGVSDKCKSHVRDMDPSTLATASIRMVFGEQGRYAIIRDDQNVYMSADPDQNYYYYASSSNIPRGLIEYFNNLPADCEMTSLERFPGGSCHCIVSASHAVLTLGYYIYTNMSTSLQKELAKSFHEHGRIIHLSVARDGSWIVIRPDTYACSGLTEAAQVRIANFYSNHKARQKKREAEIKEFRLTEQTRKTNPDKDEAVQKQLTSGTIDDFLFDVQSKRLAIGDKVTVAGMSSSPGDFVVKRIERAFAAVIVGTTDYYEKIIHDTRRIIRYEENVLPTTEQQILITVSDKYEAAVATYCDCICMDNVCCCHHVRSSSFVSRSVLETAETNGLGAGTPRIHCAFATACRSGLAPKCKKPIIEHRGEILPFDEYKCAEKIDLKRLKKIVEDLAADSTARSQMIQKLQGKESMCKKWVAHLRSCSGLELTATTLYNELKDYPTDDSGCVIHEVEYEHRDPSFRGRLFAIGKNVQVSRSKVPRVTTLQGMHHDLRAPLVGSFAHDIDCENSAVRLLCSLASQHGLVELVPILFDYRDRYSTWISCIRLAHHVTESDAKRLANVIISGGQYKGWRKGCNVVDDTSKTVRKFAFDLETQTAVLRQQLLKHRRFQWICLDRVQVCQRGREGSAVDIVLLPRIIAHCENEVLRIIHRHFHSCGWIVRAKIFDGLIVERGYAASTDLEKCLRSAEKACQVQGWDIRLLEKPLRGKQDDPIQAVVDARAVMREAHHVVSCPPTRTVHVGLAITQRRN